MFKRIISLLLAGAMCMSITAANAFAAEDNKSELRTGVFVLDLSEEFYEVSENTVVFYLEDQPIYKYQINEDGTVNMPEREEREPASVSEVYGTLPSGKSNAIVRTTLSANRYSATNTTYYFTSSKGAKFARGIEYSSAETIAATVASFIPTIGPTVTIMFGLDALYKSNVASQIRDRTDDGNKVKIAEAKSSYGTLYSVSDWTGSSFLKYRTYSDGSATETVTNLQYE